MDDDESWITFAVAQLESGQWTIVDGKSRSEIAFGGIPVYREDTREAALEGAERLASKWDARVVD